MPEWFDPVRVIEIGLFIVIAGAAVAYLRSRIAKQAHEEAVELADVRGERIKDLEAEVGELRREVAAMRGQMEAMQALKVNAIADAVALRLRDQ